MKEEIKFGQAEIKRAIEGKLDALVADIEDGRKERATCQEETKAYPEQTEPNPGLM
jgi:hypothetical protein